MVQLLTPDQVEALVAAARALPPLDETILDRYFTLDAKAAQELQERGALVVPGLRLQDRIEAALTAYSGNDVELGTYIRAAYAENRISRPRGT